MFYTALKKLRKELGLTQAELAHIAHVNQNTVSRWEANIIEPALQTVMDLALYFQVSMDEMVGLDDYAEEKERLSMGKK